MRRKVTRLTAQRAFETIKIVAEAAIDGERAITYSELAKRLGMPNDTGRGLGAILDEAAHKCVEHDLPQVPSFVVTKESFDAGQPMPSEDSFGSEGVWPISGITPSDIPAAQDEVRNFDWLSQKTLNLKKK